MSPLVWAENRFLSLNNKDESRYELFIAVPLWPLSNIVGDLLSPNSSPRPYLCSPAFRHRMYLPKRKGTDMCRILHHHPTLTTLVGGSSAAIRHLNSPGLCLIINSNWSVVHRRHRAQGTSGKATPREGQGGQAREGSGQIRREAGE